jgi:benzoate-CoA ligase family protein
MSPFEIPEQLNIATFFLHAQAQQHPNRTAILFEDRIITYRQLSEDSHRAAAVFQSLGLEMEQRVLLVLPDVPQFASAWFGTVQSGAAVSAINPSLKADELQFYLTYTRAKLVVTTSETALVISTVRHQCPYLKHVLVIGPSAEQQLNYDVELAKATPHREVAPTHRDDVCAWLYTSGSTGFPKGAVHKHRDFVFNALTFGLPILQYQPDDICISVPRLAFGYALGTNLLFPLLAGAAVALFPEKPTAEKVLEMIVKHRPSVLTAVPTALNHVLSSPQLPSVDFSSLRLAVSAGEALPAELYQRWHRRTGVEILDGIGSAEMFHIFISNRLGDVKVGSLGRVVDGYEAKVCDASGHEVPRGDIGTLWVRGDSMALEYWQHHEKSKATFRGEWCVSADTFQQDDAGYFYFCGRGDDMLKVGGKWLSPAEVENALLQHPAVKEAAIVAYKDADGLDKPRAFVALFPGHVATAALEESIKSHVRSVLEPFKAPRCVTFMDALPRSERGKVLKNELRA